MRPANKGLSAWRRSGTMEDQSGSHKVKAPPREDSMRRSGFLARMLLELPSDHETRPASGCSALARDASLAASILSTDAPILAVVFGGRPRRCILVSYVPRTGSLLFRRHHVVQHSPAAIRINCLTRDERGVVTGQKSHYRRYLRCCSRPTERRASQNSLIKTGRTAFGSE